MAKDGVLFFAEAYSRIPPARSLALVAVERALRPCAWLFAPLRDEVTWIAHAEDQAFWG
jgi:hypothetical protein